MANLNKIVYLSEEQKNTLFTTGSVTANGTTITYNPNDLYITPPTYDAIPTENSSNLITSGAVYSALNSLEDANTTYTFTDGTNGFTVTPSGGTAQTVNVTPSIANNITGSGTNGSLTKFNGPNTITNGPALSAAVSSQTQTTKFLREDGTWAAPTYTINTNTDTLVKQTAKSDNVDYKLLTTVSASPTSGNAAEAGYNANLAYNPSTNTFKTGNVYLTGTLTVTGQTILNDNFMTQGITATDLLVNGNSRFNQIPISITPEATSNDTSVATTAFVKNAIGGLSGAMHFRGTTTSAITDGSTTNPITISGSSYTAAAGDVVLREVTAGNIFEYVWTGSAWEMLGRDASFKVTQTAVSSPAANGSTTAFIDTISQDINGNITVTKKNLDTSGTWSGTAAKATADGSGNNIVNTYLTKAAGMTNVAWDNTNKKLTKTINGSTTDVVAVTVNNPTLAWNTESTVAKIGTVEVKVKMPVNPNTDEKVKQTAKTDNVNYKILTTTSASPTSGAAAEAAYGANLTYNPSTNTLATGNASLTGTLNVTGNTTLHNETTIDSATIGSMQVNGAVNFVQNPTAPTAASTDNSTKLATTEFVKNVVLNALEMVFDSSDSEHLIIRYSA